MKKLVIYTLLFLLIACNGRRTSSDYSDTSSVTPSFDGIKADNCDCHIYAEGSFIWNGSCESGYANGIGTIEWTSSEKKYEGTVSNGYITGSGKMYSNGTLEYDGSFNNGKYSGQGRLYGSSGNLNYDGMFSNNQPNGYGTLYDSDGSIKRKGNFIDGEFEQEKKVIDIADELGRKVVQDVFLGGKSIGTRAISVIYNEDRTKYEVVLDLWFNGDIIESNYYDCRIAVRNYYPEIEFVRKNDNVENFQNFQKVMGFAAAAAIISNEFEDKK